MFDEPEETPAERASDPAARAREKLDEFRMHAELAAVFEGRRKFGAKLLTDLEPDRAREVQRTIARLEKLKIPDAPVLSAQAESDAAALLNLPETAQLFTGDYHIHRRPGETMIVRWLAAEQVEVFYQRLQAHFDAALNQVREEERQSHGWKQDPDTLAYLEALDSAKVSMAERYLREIIRKHRVYVLSTQTADELDILHLTDFLMGAAPADVVGRASAPPDQPSERDRAWFFKLFALRGMPQDIEKMCFFAYLQKAEETFEESW
jgi:hypothetical protein